MVEDTEAYRLVHGEADHLPSIVVDRYGDYLVIQTLSQAAETQKGVIVSLLVEMFQPKGVLERKDPKVRLLENLEQKVGVLYGEVPNESWRRRTESRSSTIWRVDRRRAAF